MDGASKFVRGDAVAGILILFINLIGGMFIGVAQHDLAFNQAAETYALLTIGDGIVAQIPSLLLSTSVAVIVTRMSRAEDMASQVFGQLFSDRRVLRVAAGLLAVLGIVPGMPNLVFLVMAAACAGVAWWLDVRAAQEGEQTAEDTDQAAQEPDHRRDLSWDDVGRPTPSPWMWAIGSYPWWTVTRMVSSCAA